MTSGLQKPPLIGPEFLVQRVGQHWQVVIRWNGADHRFEPLPSRALAESMLDLVRERYAEHMARAGFSTTMVRRDKPEGDA